MRCDGGTTGTAGGHGHRNGYCRARLASAEGAIESSCIPAVARSCPPAQPVLAENLANSDTIPTFR